MTQREKKDCSGLELDEGHLLRSGYRDTLSEQTLEVSTHLLHALCMGLARAAWTAKMRLKYLS